MRGRAITWKYSVRVIPVLAVVFTSLGLASDFPGGFVTSGAASHRTVIASGSCSKATAVQVATRLGVGVDSAIGKTPIFQVLCGPFLGPESRGMVASVAAPTGCGGSIGWAVFRFVGGAWQLMMRRPNGAFLSKSGSSDIRERVGAPRLGDPPCSPSAWNTRIWHWNGGRFAASAWKQVTPGSPSGPVMTDGYFKTPSGNIVCFHSPGPKDLPRAFLACGIKSGLKPAPPHRACQVGGYAGDRVQLLATGRVSVPSCAGDPGALVGESAARVLDYGKTWRGGGIRCTSALVGLTCRNKSGHGFFLSRESWRRF